MLNTFAGEPRVVALSHWPETQLLGEGAAMISKASRPRLGKLDLKLDVVPVKNWALSREINQDKVTAIHPRPPQEEHAKAQWGQSLR